MQVNSSEAEKTISVLISGLNTYVLNTVGNLEQTLTQASELIKEKDERIKTLESEIQALEKQVDDLKDK